MPFQWEADAFANGRCVKFLTRPANRAKPHVYSKEAEALIEKGAIVLGV